MAILITTLWAVGYLVAIIEQDYSGVAQATPVMLVAAAYLFGTGMGSQRNGRGSGKDLE